MDKQMKNRRIWQRNLLHRLIGLMTLTAVAIAGMSMSILSHANIPSQIVGSTDGQNFRDLVPAGGRISKIRVRWGYYINAFQFTTEANGVESPGPVVGSDEGGEVTIYTLAADEFVTRITGTYNQAEYLKTLTIHTNKRQLLQAGWDMGPSAFEFKVPIGSEFAGFVGRQSGWLKAIGILSRPSSGPSTVRNYEIAPTVVQNQVANTAGQQQAVQSPQNGVTQQQTTQAPNSNEISFNPFSEPAVSPSPPTQPTTQAPIQISNNFPVQQSSSNPFDNANTNAQNGEVIESLGSSTQAQAPTNPMDQYVGMWIESNVRAKMEGDGRTSPLNWKVPRTVVVSKRADDILAIQYHENPTLFYVARKQSDTVFVDNNGLTATFSKTEFPGKPAKLFLQLTGRTSDDSGLFELAALPDGYLSRDRFSEEVRSTRDPRRGLFNQDGLTKEWNANFYGYDGLNMNLFDADSGKKIMIFGQPGNFDYAVDDDVNLGLPYGLRGMRIRSSAAQQRETIITNASEFQKSMSYNFGGGGGAGSAALGLNYSYNKTSGTNQSSSSMNALAMVHIERYALILDKPNMQLADNFRREIEALVAGNGNPRKIIDMFGSHYANAIIFGGLAKAEKSMSADSIKSYMSEKYEVGGSGSFKGANLSGGFSEGNSRSNSNESVFNSSEFEARGGNGAADLVSWTVTDGDTVPVRYDLHPISELLSPVFFPSNGDGRKAFAYNAARTKLAKAIDAYMASGPKLSNVDFGPTIYEIKFSSLQCVQEGDDGASISVYGKILFMWHDDSGIREITLFDEKDGKFFYCGGPGEKLTNRAIAMLTRNSPESGESGFGKFAIYPAQLFERDISLIDPDDPIKPIVNLGGSRTLESHADEKKRADLFGIYPAPTLAVHYSIRKLN
jgi:Jacalin-like lectin domain/MAC/Perforin domain